MKKLLLLLAGLLFAVLPTSAQIYQVSQDGIKTAEELTTGDYLIYAILDGTAKKSGYVNYSETGADSRHYLTSPLEIVSGLVSNPNYIWTVTKTTEGSFEFVLKSDPTIYWIDDTKWGQNMTSSTEKAVLTAENSEEGIKFKPAEEMNTNEDVLATDTYLNCNGPINTNYNSLSY